MGIILYNSGLIRLLAGNIEIVSERGCGCNLANIVVGSKRQSSLNVPAVKHLHRYSTEFSGHHNCRPLNTEDQMKAMVMRSVGKQLRYEDLMA